MARSQFEPFVGDLWRVLLRAGLPVALGLAGHATFNLVDLAMVGTLGGDAVAGVHVASVVGFVPMIVGNAISVATMSMMARALGALDLRRATALSDWSQVLLACLGVLFGLVGVACAAPTIAMQGVGGEAFDIGVDYLVVSHLGTVTMFVLMQTTASMRARGESFVPAGLLIGANAINVALNFVFIFGWDALGVPAFGAVGAAYATVLARGLGAAVGIGYLVRAPRALRCTRFVWRGPPGAMWEVVRLSVPCALQMVMRAAVVLVLTRWTADLGGLDAVIALGVATRFDTVVLFAAIGYAGAATAVVGHALGAGLAGRARAASHHAALQAALLGALLATTFAVFAADLVRLFVTGASPAAIAAGVAYLQIAVIAQPFAAAAIAYTGALHGAGRTVAPFVLDVIGLGGGLVVIGAAHHGSVEDMWWWVACMYAGTTVLHGLHAACARWDRVEGGDGFPGPVESARSSQTGR